MAYVRALGAEEPAFTCAKMTVELLSMALQNVHELDTVYREWNTEVEQAFDRWWARHEAAQVLHPLRGPETEPGGRWGAQICPREVWSTLKYEAGFGLPNQPVPGEEPAPAPTPAPEAPAPPPVPAPAPTGIHWGTLGWLAVAGGVVGLGWVLLRRRR